MWKIIKQNAMSLTIMAILVVVCLYLGRDVQSKVYDCSRAEIHPDYPAKVKQACREHGRKTNESSK